MEWLNILSMISVLSGIILALCVATDLYGRWQSMKIMNSVWILTALWGGVAGFCAYLIIGRAKRSDKTGGKSLGGAKGAIEPALADSVNGMQMTNMEADTHRTDHMDGMNMGNDMAGMKMDDMNMPSMKSGHIKPFAPDFKSVALSTLHCGAGCALADIIGEWFLWFVPIAIGGSLLLGEWVFVYILALCIGVFFQYLAVREMSQIKPSVAIKKAFKADFFSLTAWQVGMYGWVAVMTFLIFPNDIPQRITWTYWFMMQIAMGVGFCLALPVNYLLIKLGVKKAM